MRFIPQGVAFIFLLAPLPVLADAGPTLTEPEKLTLERFGTAHPACHEWTDGCAICLRHTDKASVACSLPGIACEPRDIACRDPVPTPPPATPPDPKLRDP